MPNNTSSEAGDQQNAKATSIKAHVKSVVKKLSQREVEHTESYLVKVYEALVDVVNNVEKVAQKQFSQAVSSVEEQHILACKKHLHFISLLVKDIPYPSAVRRSLPVYYEQLFHLSFTSVPMLERWLAEAIAEKRTTENSKVVQLVEQLKIDLIRCFYRFVQSYAEYLNSRYYAQMMIFVFGQLETYKKSRHDTILIAMDFMRILCTTYPDEIRRFASKLLQSTCRLLTLSDAQWEDQEFSEIIQLIGHVIMVILPARKPYCSCTKPTDDDDRRVELNAPVLSTIREDATLQQLLVDAFNAIVEDLQQDKVSESALFGLVYITALLGCAATSDESKQRYYTHLTQCVNEVKGSIEYLLQEEKVVVSNVNFAVFVRSLRKLLQYCPFDTSIEPEASPLSVIRYLIVTIKSFVDTQPEEWRKEHEKPYSKLLCAFVQACGTQIDAFAGDRRAMGFLDVNHNILVQNFVCDELLYIVYSQYVANLVRMGPAAEEKLLSVVVPAIFERVLEDIDLRDESKLQESNSDDHEEGNDRSGFGIAQGAKLAETSRSEMRTALKCLIDVINMLKPVPSSAQMLRQTFYERLQPIFKHLLQNCLLSTGDAVIEAQRCLLLALKDNAASDELLTKELPIVCASVFQILQQKYAGDRIELPQERSSGSDEQEQQEEVVDAMSNLTFSGLDFFEALLDDDTMLHRVISLAGPVLGNVFQYVCKKITKDTLHEGEEVERIVQSKLALKLLKRCIHASEQSALFKGNDVKTFIQCHIDGIKLAVEEEDIGREIELLNSLNELSADETILSLLMKHLEKGEESTKKHSISGQHKQLLNDCQALYGLLQKQLKRFESESKTLFLTDREQTLSTGSAELDELMAGDDDEDDEEMTAEELERARAQLDSILQQLTKNLAVLLPPK